MKDMKESNPFEKTLRENTVRIGLFWFSKDYAKIIRIEGEQEISNSNLLKPRRVDPIGLHAEYDMPRDVPRGRICYDNGTFKIWVGEDCIVEDENLIGMIKENFNLKRIDASKFRIKRHYHWNTKS